MLTDSQLRSKIDALWDKLWSGGLSNPLDAIEQLSFLLFLKQLDEREQDAERAYYTGIICERRAKAYLNQNSGGSSFNAYEKLTEAMGYYEKAESLRPPGNDDALLRWNTCARLIMQNKLVPRAEEAYEPSLE